LYEKSGRSTLAVKMTKEFTHKRLKLDQLDSSLCDLRITRPGEQEKMNRSLRLSGQLNPLIVRVTDNDSYQILDGFKRYHSAKDLGWDYLDARIVDVSLAQGKTMMLSYNKSGRSLLDYDEALIVYSLKKDHALEQSAISSLTGYSRSWVCRRLALIEKLDPKVQDSLRLGVITHSQARAIVKLPRGNQVEFVRCIADNQLTSRDSQILAEKYLEASDRKNQQYILSHATEIIKKHVSGHEVYDNRLSHHGNRLLKSIEFLLIQQNIFTGLSGQHMTKTLDRTEKDILGERIEKLGKSVAVVQSIINQKIWKDEG
jgi:ParB family transcriptional regulator, chromosome partitioning protein